MRIDIVVLGSLEELTRGGGSDDYDNAVPGHGDLYFDRGDDGGSSDDSDDDDEE